MPIYYVSGVHKTTNGVITHLLIHPTTDQKVLKGTLFTLAQAINFIRAGNACYTCRYDYETESWFMGEKIYEYPTAHGPRLRTRPDAVRGDNLDNMLLLGLFYK